MAESTTNQRRGIPVIRLTVAITAIYLGIEWLGKPLFIGKHISGIYWLFVLADETILPLAGMAGVAFIGVLIASLVQFARKRANGDRLLAISITLLLSGLALLTALPPFMARHTVHMDSLRVHNHVYYLAAYPLFDTNYALFECDSLGLLCNRIYLSPDLIGPETWPGTLTYQPDKNELSVNAGEEQGIFKYTPP
jgi:hypothetical protein